MPEEASDTHHPTRVLRSTLSDKHGTRRSTTHVAHPGGIYDQGRRRWVCVLGERAINHEHVRESSVPVCRFPFAGGGVGDKLAGDVAYKCSAGETVSGEDAWPVHSQGVAVADRRLGSTYRNPDLPPTAR